MDELALLQDEAEATVPGAGPPPTVTEHTGEPNPDILPNHPFPAGDRILPARGSFRLKDPNAFIHGFLPDPTDTIVVGIDEAGRGACMGPVIYGICWVHTARAATFDHPLLQEER